MGRNAIVTREKIVAAARTLITRYGFFKTTIEDIAKSLHVGKSALYYYFKDKDEIIKAMLAEDIGKIKDQILQILAATEAPQDKLKKYSVIRMTFFKEYATVYSVLKDEYMLHFAYIQKIRKEYDEFEASLIREIMAEGVKKGIFSIKDIDLTSLTVFAAIKGMEYDWANRFDVASIEKNINAMFEILLFGIMKRKGALR